MADSAAMEKQRLAQMDALPLYNDSKDPNVTQAGTDSAELIQPDSFRARAPKSKWLGFAKVLLALGLVYYWAIKLDVASLLARPSEQEAVTKPKVVIDDDQICNTPECVIAAANILTTMSPKYKELDPCDDFHLFSCDGFEKTHELRADQALFGTFQLIADRNSLILNNILRAPLPKRSSAHDDDDINNLRKLQEAYIACMDVSELQKLDFEPFIDLILDYNKQVKEDDTFETRVAFLTKLDVQFGFDIGIEADDKNPDYTIFSIKPTHLYGLPSSEDYQDEKVVQQYTDLLEGVYVPFLQELDDRGIKTNGNPKHIVKRIVELEKEVTAAAPTMKDLFDPTKSYNKVPFDQIDDLTYLNTSHFLSKFKKDFHPDHAIVSFPKFFKKLFTLAKKHDLHTKENIDYWLYWRLLQSFSKYTESSLFAPIEKFNSKLAGKDPNVREDRWKTCVKAVDSQLGFLLSRPFVQEAFSAASKSFGEQIIRDIKHQYIERFNEVEWMSDEVKKVAAEKVNEITMKIGYPVKAPDLSDPKDLNDFYKDIKISPKHYLQNTLYAIRDSNAKNWADAGGKTNRDAWDMTASTVNAYYNPPGNEIVFPAGIMQAPGFYPPSLPLYLSYGAFGAVAGHELSHAFDDLGRHYDPTGNFTDWWDNSTVAAFEERADCFVDQYHNYTVPTPNGTPLHLNGRLTLGENLADNGGLTAAYRSWKARDAEKPDLVLPGLTDFTKDQLFYLSFGNFWCDIARPEIRVIRARTDPHSPEFVRLLGAIANSRGFKEAFQCKNKEPVCEMF